MAVKPVPDGYHTVTPLLVARGAAELIEFMKRAFAAEEKDRFATPDGTIMHAEVRIGNSIVMMGEASGEFPPMPCVLYLYVDDADTVYQRAVRAGATSIMEPANQFWGDRSGGVRDAWGNIWWIATHVEDVSQEELARRSQEHFAQHGASHG